MHFYGVAPGVPRSEITIIESVSLRRIFFIFDQNWESLGIRDISEKLAIFARMSVTKVRFYTRRCALLELLLKLKHFSKKLRTHFNQGWTWDGTASPKDFCPRDLSPKAQNPGTVPRIFVPVPKVPWIPGTQIPWDSSPIAHP